MQNEMMRQPEPDRGSDNVGDVLASIRRLIAQDKGDGQIPDSLLNALPDTARDELKAAVAPTPLKLDSNDLIAPEPAPTDDDDPPAQARLRIAQDNDAPEPQAEPERPQPEPQLEADPKAKPAAEASTEDEPAEAETGQAPALQAAPPEQDMAADEPSAETPEPHEVVATPCPDLQDDNSSTTQAEDTMLHAQNSVTQINAAASAAPQIEDGTHDDAKPHLFARKDGDTQKGAHLRGMIREAIRQELQGEIGTRLSRNLQQMIRHEIELTLRQMCEQE